MKNKYLLRCVHQTKIGNVLDVELIKMDFADDDDAIEYGMWRFGRYDSDRLSMLYLSLTNGNGIVVFERMA